MTDSRMTSPLPRWQAVLLSMSQSLSDLPPELDSKSLDTFFLDSISRFARHMPVFHFLFLRLACLLFEIFPIFFGLGPAFYTHLPVAARKNYFERWLGARFVLFRDVAKTLRSMSCVFYFSNPEISRYMDYDPHTHIEERIALREKLLKKQMG